MEINYAYLLSTPLDSNYENVIDFNGYQYDYKGAYASLLAAKFYYCNVPIPLTETGTTRALNLNKKETLTIKMSGLKGSDSRPLSEHINEINYIVINGKDEKWYFYFVTNYTYNNSMDTVTFELKWDAWANNIDTLMTAPKRESFIKNRHIDTFTYDDYIDRATSKNFLSDEIAVEGVDLIDESNLEYDVIYQRMIIEDGTRLHVTDDASSQEYGYFSKMACFRAFDPLRVIYIPFDVVNRKTRESIFQADLDITYVKIKINNGFAYDWNNYRVRTAGSLQRKGFLIYSDLTTLSNITFTLDDTDPDQPYLNFTTPTSNVAWYEGENQVVMPVFASLELIDYGGTKRYKNEVPVTKLVAYRINSCASKVHAAFSSNSDSYKKMFEPRIHQFPYEYEGFYVGGNMVPFVLEYNSERITYMFSFNQHYNPQYKLWDSDEQPAEYKCFTNFGSLPVTDDRLSQFLRENQSQWNWKPARIGMNFAKNVVNSAASSKSVEQMTSEFTGATTGALAELGNLYVDVAQAREYASTIHDQSTIPATYASDEPHYQDSFLNAKHEMHDEVNEERLLKKLVYFGVSYDMLGDPLENTRLNFDFVQTNGAYLPVIKNQQDRAEIQSAFNRGIRKWHADSCNDTAFATFNLDYTNIQKSLEGLI